ncbi:MAG: hypothetical protein Kow0027_19060 [Saprospiraceae bacterium]
MNVEDEDRECDYNEDYGGLWRIMEDYGGLWGIMGDYGGCKLSPMAIGGRLTQGCFVQLCFFTP